MAALEGFKLKVGMALIFFILVGSSDSKILLETLQESTISSVIISCSNQAPVKLSSQKDLGEIKRWLRSAEGPLIGSFIGPSGKVKVELAKGTAIELGIGCRSELNLFGLIYTQESTYGAGYTPKLSLRIPLALL